MNNNNLYNTNNFIGITHNDYFKTASNALAKEIYIQTSNCSNYASNMYINCSNYASNISNILNINSSNYTNITSNIIQTNINKLINEKVESIILPLPADLTHTYITNSNILGEIRFWTKSTADFFLPPNLIGIAPDYRAKIRENGTFELYYVYNPAINLTFLSGWIDVATSIVALNASDANIGLAITGLEGQLLILQNNISRLATNTSVALADNMLLEWEEAQAYTASFREAIYDTPTGVIGTFENLTNNLYAGLTQARVSYVAAAGTDLTLLITQNPGVSFFLGIGGIAYAAAVSLAQDVSYIKEYTHVIEDAIYSNVNITQAQKDILYSSNNRRTALRYVSYCSNMSNMTIAQGFINTYNSNQQYIPSIKCETLDLNSGNITAVNTINVNTINISGKVKQFGNYLDDTYLKPEDLYNLSYNYTTERRYPPKAYNSSTTEKTVNLLGTLVYNQTLILDNIGITYGEGQYEIYSSSTYDNGITNKDKLFNFNNTETVNTPRWAINQYESGTGDYQGNSSIDGVDFGDFIIIKLPLPFLLTRFRIYKNTAFPQLAPSLWKCFGSSDGIEWFEIFQAHNFTRLTEANYNFGYYEKTLANTFTTLFNYIGFSFNSLTGTSGATSLNFSELQLFGKEQLSYNIDSYIYTTPEAVKVVVRDQMPDVPKRRGFIVSIPNTATYYDATTNITYYKYDLDLRLYLTQQIVPNTTDPYRSFKFACWYTPSYFGSYINSQPYVISYTIFMSNKANAILGQPDTAGLNIYAVGFPENVRLANILPNNIMLLKNANNNFNYLTIVSRIAPCDINCIIEDQLF